MQTRPSGYRHSSISIAYTFFFLHQANKYMATSISLLFSRFANTKSSWKSDNCQSKLKSPSHKESKNLSWFNFIKQTLHRSNFFIWLSINLQRNRRFNTIEYDLGFIQPPLDTLYNKQCGEWTGFRLTVLTCHAYSESDLLHFCLSWMLKCIFASNFAASPSPGTFEMFHWWHYTRHSVVSFCYFFPTNIESRSKFFQVWFHKVGSPPPQKKRTAVLGWTKRPLLFRGTSPPICEPIALHIAQGLI